MTSSARGASSATNGTLFAVGVSGAAAGPLAFLLSPAMAYSIFLGIAAVAATLDVVGMGFEVKKT